jgi:hypothetical protein
VTVNSPIFAATAGRNVVRRTLYLRIHQRRPGPKPPAHTNTAQPTDSFDPNGTSLPTLLL